MTKAFKEKLEKRNKAIKAMYASMIEQGGEKLETKQKIADIYGLKLLSIYRILRGKAY